MEISIKLQIIHAFVQYPLIDSLLQSKQNIQEGV
jgi:hypothetical protein